MTTTVVPMRSVSDDEFWFDSDAMADPWRPPHAAEAAWMQDQLRELACKIAGRISARGQECLVNGHEPSAMAELFADWQLAYLHALRRVHEAAEALAAEAALMGGGMGATYGHLGSAWGISKQAARKKWPGAVDDGSGQPEKITVERYGGVAEITYLPDRCAWGWAAHGDDGTYREAEEAYTVRWIAMSAAEDFLRDHAVPWEGVDVPHALGDPKDCWCWDDDVWA
ncbi:hypothetical protein SAM23877_4061 [Streptomyces ambofaciens ATCC 23877]|uniref:Uncharacterized protein n=2 Tax=Streptomyces ambofaciens TaxID=1889 RepID=A0A0K2AW31_STRA7|nr:hypothetical protein SAM23877_4061 [Streptomyces ambofaciens ATCC 23877]